MGLVKLEGKKRGHVRRRMYSKKRGPKEFEYQGVKKTFRVSHNCYRPMLRQMLLVLLVKTWGSRWFSG